MYSLCIRSVNKDNEFQRTVTMAKIMEENTATV